MSNRVRPSTRPSLVLVLTHLARDWRSASEDLIDERDSHATRLRKHEKFLGHPIQTLFRLIAKRTKISSNDLEWMAWYIDVRAERTPQKAQGAVFYPEPTGVVYDSVPSDTPTEACVQYLRSIYEDLAKLDANGGARLILGDFDSEHPGLVDAIIAEAVGPRSQESAKDVPAPAEARTVAARSSERAGQDDSAVDEQIRDLQADFRRIADKAPWARATFTVKDGRFGIFGLRRPDGTLQDMQENAMMSELHALTEQASALMMELIRSKRYQLTPIAMKSSNYHIGERWGMWLFFLLRSPQTFAHCWAVGPHGDSPAVAAIDESQNDAETTVWIESYPQVCVSALSWLKANVRRSPVKTYETNGAPADSSDPRPANFEILPGAIKYGDETVKLSGKPLACIRELNDAFQNRLDWETLRNRIWGQDAYTEKGTIKNAMKDARDALRKLARKAGLQVDKTYDPLPCVDKGKDLAWMLNFPG